MTYHRITMDGKYSESIDGVSWTEVETGESMTKAKRVISDTDAVSQIFSLLDGKEWDSDTLEEIACIITFAGYEILDPNEMEETE